MGSLACRREGGVRGLGTGVSRFELKQIIFQSDGRAGDVLPTCETTDSTAGGNDPVAGDEQRQRIGSHGCSGGSRRPGGPGQCGQLPIRDGRAARHRTAGGPCGVVEWRTGGRGAGGQSRINGFSGEIPGEHSRFIEAACLIEQRVIGPVMLESIRPVRPEVAVAPDSDHQTPHGGGQWSPADEVGWRLRHHHILSPRVG